MEEYVYVNGTMVPKRDASVSVLDHSFMYGNGVFETLRSYKGHVFLMEEHLSRLYRSASAIFLDIKREKIYISDAVYKTLSVNKYSDSYIRITISRGTGEPGLNPDLCKEPTIVIYAKTFLPYPEEWYINGVKVSVVSIVKPSSGSIKTPLKSCNYIYNFLGKREAGLKGALEGIMLNQAGNVTEGTVSNIFIKSENGLKTAPPGEVVLDGVTRNVVVELARQNGIEVQEKHFSVEELNNAQECFITNTTFEVLPVSFVDSQKIGNGKPGTLTLKLLRYFQERVQKEI
jgi:branched-chain amino acid aminotransferase